MTDTQQTTETKPPTGITDPNLLLGVLVKKLKETLNENGPTAASVLEWLATQDKKVIRAAIKSTQPKGWAIAVEPFTDSLTDDQAVGALAALMAVFAQTL